tara:strand:+ start:9963 stop:11927 length:1965 start_codon:yes stop_codon:yes gene_type:complete
MKNKKLKRYSLINIITGYTFAALFIVLIMLNTQPEVVNVDVVVAEADELFVPVDQNITVERTRTADRFLGHPIIIDRDVHRTPIVGVDRLTGVIVNDANPHVAVVRGGVLNTNLHEGYIENDWQRDRVVGVDGSVLNRDTHRYSDGRGNRRGNLHVDRVNDHDRVLDTVDEDVDYGLLDRRLAALEPDIRDRAINKSPVDDSINLNLGQLTVAGDDDAGELGDITGLGLPTGTGKGEFGVGKGGELYAYNFPSRGVGAGIGSGGVGAGAGGSAGLGAGIGQGVLDGETVPTLGGIGTYSTVDVVTPGTGTDTDGDGLTAEAEAVLGTDPAKPDSDGDGYVDGAEIEAGTNPKNAQSNPGIPGSEYSPSLGGVGGLVGGAGAGGAAGLVTGMVTEKLGTGVGAGCAECGGECKGHGHGSHADYDHLPKDGALHIMMHVDGSGSILNTRKQLDIMKDTLLKDALLPYYNNNEDLYNRRVKIVDGNGERTLQFFAEAAKKDNVLALVFQDEAAPAYHLPTFNKKPQDHYSKDIGKLKASLNGYGGVYRGVMFQVDRGRTFAKSFKEFVESAWRGEGYLRSSNLKKYYRDNNTNHIKNKDGIVFSDEYHAKDSGDPQYYLDLIFKASKKVGLDLNIYGAGVTDGVYVWPEGDKVSKNQ